MNGFIENNNMKIAIIYSLPTRRAVKSKFIASDDDTVESAHEVEEALKEKGTEVFLVPVSEDDIDGTIRNIRADCIVNIIDWTGLDLVLSIHTMDVLVATGIPFTGASRDAFERGADKILMKQTLDAHKLPTPRWQLFETGKELVTSNFSYPCIVKLAKEHCSVGLGERSIVNNGQELIAKVREQLITYKQPVIVEEFLTGREFQITLLEEETGLVMLPPAEVTYKVKGTRAMLSYESRWDEKHPDFHTSGMALATLTPQQVQEFEKICKATFRAFGFFDFTRIDARFNEKNQFMILEANANPGLSHDPLYGMTVSYQAVGMTFADFVWKIVESCARRTRSIRIKK
ncbi:MAG: hypothetical protein V1917_01435 [Candidatus Gottesmanbacteria bacterium]